MSDKTPAGVTSGSTREFMALCRIRPSAGPTPRPTRPGSSARPRRGRMAPPQPDPRTRRCCARRARAGWERYNGVRLHAGIGYVTPATTSTSSVRRSARRARLDWSRPCLAPRAPSRVRGARRCWLIDPRSLTRTQKQVNPAYGGGFRSWSCGGGCIRGPLVGSWQTTLEERTPRSSAGPSGGCPRRAKRFRGSSQLPGMNTTTPFEPDWLDGAFGMLAQAASLKSACIMLVAPRGSGHASAALRMAAIWWIWWDAAPAELS